MQRLFLILFLCASAQATVYDRYVDTGSVGGDGTTNAVAGANAAYATLAAGETAMDGVAGAGDTVNFYCRRTNGGGEDGAVSFYGWNAGATINVYQTDFPTNGVYDGTKYVIHNNDATAYTLYVRAQTMTFHNLQILTTSTGTNDRAGAFWAVAAGATTTFDSCIFKGACSGTGNVYAIRGSDADATITVYNCSIYGFKSGASMNHTAVSNSTSTTTLYNCTVEGNYRGLSQSGGTLTAKNCAVFNNDDDFAGTIACTNCASDDADASTYTSGQDFTAEATDWNKVFTDYTTGDFRLLDYTTPPCCVGVGLDDPGSGLYSDDIAGNTRTSTWDIGAFEYGAAPPAPPTQVRYLFRK